MNNKFLLQQLDDNGNVIKEKEMKTLKLISELLNIEYFQARQLYLHCKKNTKAHPFLKELSKTYRIIDNPKLMRVNVNLD
jgi:hypothetical protein